MPHIGQPIPRLEDRRFLTGAGQYTDDLKLPGQLHAAVVRSPHPHARIEHIDASQALAIPEVLAVYTAPDLRAAGVGDIPSFTRTEPYQLLNRDGSEMALGVQYPLAEGKVRFVGDAVAFVVAETHSAARSAAEQVQVDYQPLPSATDVESALAPAAAPVWDDVPDNRAFDWADGDQQAVDRAFANAAHRTHVDVLSSRLIVAFMEPRGILADYDAHAGRYVLRVGCQSGHSLRDNLSGVLGVEPERIRVIVPDTGGGFGSRNVLYAEFVLAAFAARTLARPVKWVADRSEACLTDAQARDQQLTADLAMDAAGRFLAIRVRATWRLGPYIPSRNLWVLVSHFAPMICGVYDIPLSYCEMHGVFTNTAPVASLRGVARAEAAYVVERLVEAAARDLGVEPLALRRQNIIRRDATPYTLPTGAVYESVDFEANLDAALAAAHWPGFPARRAESAARGQLRGIGLATFVESTGGAPSELADIAVDPHGTVIAHVGTQDFGMGHATVFSQVLADELAVDMDGIRVIDGDTDKIRMGFGAHGSRSMRIGGGAVVLGARALIEKGRQLAAEHLEAAAADIEYANGAFSIAGTDRSVSFASLAEISHARDERLAAEHEYTVAGRTYTNGCHVSEVEVDPDTGVVTLLGHTFAVDVGRRINPLIVDGQMHGGITQGIGQAPFEAVVYDRDSGQLLSASFMDYDFPKADRLPNFTLAFTEVPTSENPLGVKGAGECSTTGSPPAVVNAVLDALRERGVTHIDMPATPERIWRALRGRGESP